jgi:hypothetical protein
VDKIRNPQEFATALRRYRIFKAREVKYRGFVEKYRDMIVRWMEKKNKKVATDDQGNRYQKRQPVRIVFPDNARDLKKLLKKKGVDPNTVVRMVPQDPVMVVDEQEILRLLKMKVITSAEFESVVIRQTYTPHIARMNEKKRAAKKGKPAGRGRRS